MNLTTISTASFYSVEQYKDGKTIKLSDYPLESRSGFSESSETANQRKENNEHTISENPSLQALYNMALRLNDVENSCSDASMPFESNHYEFDQNRSSAEGSYSQEEKQKNNERLSVEVISVVAQFYEEAEDKSDINGIACKIFDWLCESGSEEDKTEAALFKQEMSGPNKCIAIKKIERCIFSFLRKKNKIGF